MCYLNGEIGGSITALSQDFGTEDYTDEYGYVTNIERPLKDIITDAVHEFAHEPLHNIIINDLDDYGIELLEYRGENPLYYLIDVATGEVVNSFFDFESTELIEADTDYDTFSDAGKSVVATISQIEVEDVEIDNLDTKIIRDNLRKIQTLNGEDAVWKKVISQLGELDNTTEEFLEVSYDYEKTTLDATITSGIVSRTIESSANTINAMAKVLDHLEASQLAQASAGDSFCEEGLEVLKQSADNCLTEKAYNELANNLLEYEQNLIRMYEDEIVNEEVLREQIEYYKDLISMQENLQYCVLSYFEQVDLLKETTTPEVYEINELYDAVNSLNYIKAKIDLTAQEINEQISTVALTSETDESVGSFFDNIIDVLDENFVFDPLFELDLGEAAGSCSPTVISDGLNFYTVAKIEYGQTAGYRITDLTYAGDLILNAGESITSMLDKIVTMLGDFEYFYDVDGRFVFQKKKTYVNTSWNNQINNQEESYVENAAYVSATQYFFEDSKLVTAFNNTPNLSNVKNDYSVWGTRKGVTGTEIPVHMRYAIDTKPSVYTSFSGITYTSMNQEEYEGYLRQNEEKITSFTKSENPNGLPDTWWELLEWSKLYKTFEGFYPTLKLGSYTHPTTIILSNYFELHPDATAYTKTCYNQGSCYIDDIVLMDGKVYEIHGSSCAHTLSWWQSYFSEHSENMVAYFHAPSIEGIMADGVFKDDVNVDNIQLYDSDKVRFEIDWRELIYQMALDYRKYNRTRDFSKILYENNPTYVKNGLTGYESYYVDLEGFWRELYNPDYVGTFEAENVTKNNFDSNEFYYMRPKFRQCNSTTLYSSSTAYYMRSTIGRTKGAAHEEADRFYLYSNGWNGSDLQYLGTDNRLYDIKNNELPLYTDFVTGSEVYYTYVYKYTPVENLSKKDFYTKPENYWYGTTDMEYCYCGWEDPASKSFKGSYRYYENGVLNSKKTPAMEYDASATYCSKSTTDFDLNTFWKTGLVQYPETLNFWFDFLEAGSSELGKYSVKAIGNRPKSANDNTVKGIYFRETPTVIFKDPADDEEPKSGYSYIQLPSSMEDLFTISSQGKSAKDVIDSWLYSYGYATESISLTALPVYYLQPNTRILVRDKESAIDGEYIISRITLPLTVKGTMNITAEKAVERIY